jgi:hypothetical protein
LGSLTAALLLIIVVLSTDNSSACCCYFSLGSTDNCSASDIYCLGADISSVCCRQFPVLVRTSTCRHNLWNFIKLGMCIISLRRLVFF